jgi:predicted MFS family arabinose efflux permease
MVTLGLGEMLGGPLIGRIIDLKSSKLACLWNSLIMALLTASTVSFLIIYRYNFLAFLTAFMWGFSDSAVNTHS